MPNMKSVTLLTACGVLAACSAESRAATALFLSLEYQAQSGANAGTIRGGDPAQSAAFGQFLNTAALTSADVVHTLTTAGDYAVWARMANPGPVTSTAIDFGGSAVTMSIAGWNTATNSLTGRSGAAVIDGFGNDGTSLQSGAPRPAFASGANSGVYIGTSQGALSDGIRNAVTFDLTSLAGGGAYSFGIFGGDLESGGPGGSPTGFLHVEFADGSTAVIDYLPDSTLFPDAAFTGSNNTSETYGNETGRFIGIADDQRRIVRVTFVVGDDDVGDNGDSEQLSFIAPIVFMHFDGTTATPLIPMQIPVPEPAAVALAASAAAMAGRRRR